MAEKPVPTENVQVTQVENPTKASAADGGTKAAPEAKSDPKAASADGASMAEEILEKGSADRWLREALFQMPSWLVSMVFHMIVLLILALWMMPGANVGNRQLVVAPGEKDYDELEELEDEPLHEIDVTTDLTALEVPMEEMEISPADDMDAAAIQVELSEFGLDHAPFNDLLATVGAYTGTGLSGRGEGNRAGLVRQRGGSEGSERAVAAALRWLAAHQCPDGGWHFDLRQVPACRGQCTQSATAYTRARIGATSMALLPFLGAGQTHKTGKYQQTVQQGLYYLVSNMKVTPQGGALNETEGRMYSHGLASIVLCEAYAMTHDKSLHDAAQASINFICYAQDPVGGGWRYEPRQAGDTSVVGWMLMALKSGHMAYLRVPPLTVKKANDYFDIVQSNSGANYGYTGPGAGDATTAIGLLCRMYLGWKKDNPALQRGVSWLGNRGPDKNNMYYNYYATQVMSHWEGEEWKKWNASMRDFLVDSQAKQGHETGSWHFPGGRGDRAGRLYDTSLATMILEVYYRHQPIYRAQSVEEEFPL